MSMSMQRREEKREEKVASNRMFMSFVLVVCQRHIDRSIIELYCDDRRWSTFNARSKRFRIKNLFRMERRSVEGKILFEENIDGAHHHHRAARRRWLPEQESSNRTVRRRPRHDKC